MRINHVGEVCAQALYASQAWGTNDPYLKAQFDAAAREETDHLAWTEQRMKELGSRPSLLNPLWYADAFGIGLQLCAEVIAHPKHGRVQIVLTGRDLTGTGGEQQHRIVGRAAAVDVEAVGR